MKNTLTTLIAAILLTLTLSACYTSKPTNPVISCGDVDNLVEAVIITDEDPSFVQTYYARGFYYDYYNGVDMAVKNTTKTMINGMEWMLFTMEYPRHKMSFYYNRDLMMSLYCVHRKVEVSMR